MILIWPIWLNPEFLQVSICFLKSTFFSWVLRVLGLMSKYETNRDASIQHKSPQYHNKHFIRYNSTSFLLLFVNQVNVLLPLVPETPIKHFVYKSLITQAKVQKLWWLFMQKFRMKEDRMKWDDESTSNEFRSLGPAYPKKISHKCLHLKTYVFLKHHWIYLPLFKHNSILIEISDIVIPPRKK